VGRAQEHSDVPLAAHVLGLGKKNQVRINKC